MRKNLGQNFLTSKDIARDVAQNAGLKKGDVVFEIGPGRGILTEALLETGAKVVALEKDLNLIPELEKRFEKEIKNGDLLIEKGDVRNIPFEKTNLKDKNYTVAANIPYYITGQIIEIFLSSETQPKKMVLMVQREVADRICTRDVPESILSLSIKVYGEPKFIRPIKAGSFYPKPKVDSAIIKIDDISKDNFKDVSEEKFFSVLKRGYQEKRKTVWNNLKNDFGTKELEKALESCRIDSKSRAETLTLENWLCLAKKL